MKRLIVIASLLILIVVVLIWKIYNGLLRPQPKDVKPQPTPAPEVQRAEPVKTVKEEKPSIAMRARQMLRTAPRYVTELFLSAEVFADQDAYVRTDQGFYRVGEISIHGMVKAIRWPDQSKLYAVISVMDEDGGAQFIIAQNTLAQRKRLQGAESDVNAENASNATNAENTTNNDSPRHTTGKGQTGGAR